MTEPLTFWQMIWRVIVARLKRDKEAGFHFLKCDSKGCPHMEFHDKLTLGHVDKPCPMCGENLLTLEDFTQYTRRKK